MNIVGIAACTSGIAHTYIAKEKLMKAGKALGHNIHIETQGTIGTEDELTKKDIEKNSQNDPGFFLFQRLLHPHFPNREPLFCPYKPDNFFHRNWYKDSRP